MLNKIKGLFIEEKGQGMTEYGLILGLIAVAVIVVLGLMGDQIGAIFTDVKDQLSGIDSSEATGTN
ncbi:Flp family type IVb pilin [Oceanobacillus massiliensis]|uniref:Flp family type IVb pilin n=1 Tax=Oceanobacillus massiliensis TaxID=1465765 RepID=UPI00028A0384|nr:Flp family type IVb pilin [Oceanobacillus massiliensis]